MASSCILLFTFLCLLAVVQAGRVFPHTFINQVRNFPNIQRDHSKCLTEAQRGTASSIYVCDRNGLLTPEEVKILHNMLKDIRQTLNSDARTCDKRRPRPTIAIAVIQKMQIENDATQEMILNYASVFAYHLFDSWKLTSRCESSKIIIFFSRDDGVLYTYAGEQLKEVLPTKKILSIALQSKQAFADGIKNGLMFILDQYKLSCEGGKRGF